MRWLLAFTMALALGVPGRGADETIWLEAEHFDGIEGFCWPSGQGKMKETKGKWGLSGPGWAAEWVQGGESGFLSIACGADDAKAVASKVIEMPRAGKYALWVRFRENRGTTNRFTIDFGEDGKTASATFGTKPNIDEDNEMKLYWNWAFAWEAHSVELPKGKIKINLRSAVAEKESRQIDCLVLTTVPGYRPWTKERPKHPTRDLLESWRANGFDERMKPLLPAATDYTTPPAWAPRTFRDKGFLYLWNMDQTKWASTDPQRVPVPYHVADDDVKQEFEKKYAGKKDVPIFGDPRLVPVFTGPGAYWLESQGPDGKPNPNGQAFLKWLDANPDRYFGTLLNYQPDKAISKDGKANFIKQRDRFVGGISGEHLGYYYHKPGVMEAACAQAKNRRELADAISQQSIKGNAEKYRLVYGEEWPDHYKEVIPCLSIDMTAYAPLCYSWGVRTMGYESSAITSGLLPMRMAFLRGAARQWGGLTATYRSCNFGDSATMFSERQNYSKVKNILDNYYSVYSGAGMTWYKMDVWQQYLSGSSMFFHEQGFDEFWRPGGTTAAGTHDVQLSPKGKIVERFLKVTQEYPDRGTPYIPIAFLVDYAHGWDPAPYQPHAFGDVAKRPELTRHGDHEQMLQELFWAAYHPIGVKAMQPMTATSEFIVPGIFGDIFDVIYAYPDTKRWTTIDTYRAVVVAGDIELTAAEGKRLNDYIVNGGTVVVCGEQLRGPGTTELKLPLIVAGDIESDGYIWSASGKECPSQGYRAKQLMIDKVINAAEPLATTKDGKAIAARYPRGKGQLIYVSIPRALGIDKSLHPVAAQILAHLTRQVMPIQVTGEVEWLVNKTATGWIVALFNPAGQNKPQQGISPTDYRENKPVTIRTQVPVKTVTDWLAPRDEFERKANEIKLTVTAGSIRVLELKP